ncbi:DUF4360 domain-containing protein [Spartinivicinus poritis]|uniref:DUF4360 domain-containing protein n=1 Tax=Spartinivicinus poritis TaxID=2994640 RepID=A0ABT5UB59_9GAMM|nr:DUF4360 domain-containing protein [Spartinivicinus sp. A2-2]MDE1463616.1 DUF4360 domain-containing protein [Spartinivicinus sp. A2-2]
MDIKKNKIIGNTSFSIILICYSFISSAQDINSESFNYMDEAPSDKVKIEVLSTIGPGCLPGSFETSISPDNKSIIVNLQELKGIIGPDISYADTTRFCSAQFILQIPDNYSYTISKASYQGHASIDENINLSLSSSFRFTEPLNDIKFYTSFDGPFEGGYWVNDSLNPSQLTWSQCGGESKLLFRTGLQLKQKENPEATGSVNYYPLGAKQQYSLLFKKC